MATLPMTSADTTASPSPVPPTLLLVDDEPSILSALRRLFRPLDERKKGRAGAIIEDCVV